MQGYSVIIQLLPWHESGDLWLSASQSITEDDLPSTREEKCGRLQRKQKKNVYPLTESHNVREGDGKRRKWRVSVRKSEGVQVLGKSTMRCLFFFLLSVCMVMYWKDLSACHEWERPLWFPVVWIIFNILHTSQVPPDVHVTETGRISPESCILCKMCAIRLKFVFLL